MNKPGATCYHCRAPLSVSVDRQIVDCQYCGTANDLRPKVQPHVAAGGPTAAKQGGGAKVALAVVAVAIAGVAAYLLVDGGPPASSRSGSSPAADRPPPEPFEIEWVSDHEFVVRGHANRKGRVSIHGDGGYKLMLQGFPEGTRWTVGDKKGVIRSRASEFADIEAVNRAELGEVPLDRYRTYGLGPTGTLILELPSGQTGTTELRKASPRSFIDEALKQIQNGRPLRFGDEPEPREAPNAIILYRPSGFETFGAAETFADVDLVAFSNRLPEVKDEIICSGYTDPDGTPTSDLTIRLKETEVVVYDRRTADVAHTKIFAPDAECPSFRMGDETTRDSYPPRREIHAWLRSLLRG
jgi:hypothetical protein